MVVVPATVIVSVCVPAARRAALNTGSDVKPGLPGAAVPAVLMDVAGPPSSDTFAMPQTSHLRPSQTTLEPVNVNVARAWLAAELVAVPPLNAATSGPRFCHAPSVVRARSFSSKRVARAAGDDSAGGGDEGGGCCGGEDGGCSGGEEGGGSSGAGAGG